MLSNNRLDYFHNSYFLTYLLHSTQKKTNSQNRSYLSSITIRKNLLTTPIEISLLL
jgi:hypothetical protein